MEHTTSTGVMLHLCKIKNQDALMSLMLSSGVYDRLILKKGEPIESMGKEERIKIIAAWGRLFAYCIVNGVEDIPPQDAYPELEAMGMNVSTPGVAKLSWVRYGKQNGVDILGDQLDAGRLVGAIILLTYQNEEAKPAQPEQGTEEDNE